ncbi:MAG: PqqD family protein [Acidobacteriota bacterium]
MLIHLAEDVLCRHLKDEAVLLDLQSQRYFGLDAVGARVWSLFQQDPSLEKALGALVEEFEADLPQLRSDVLDFVGMLVENNLATTEDPAESPPA